MRPRSLLRRIGRALSAPPLPPSTHEYAYSHSAHGRVLRTSRYTGEVEVEDGAGWRAYDGPRPRVAPPMLRLPSLRPVLIVGLLMLLAFILYLNRYEYRMGEDGIEERINRFTGETCTFWQGARRQWICELPPEPIASPTR